MVQEQELGKEVTTTVVAWVVQAELNSRHFLSNSDSKDTVGIEDIEQDMETIGSRVKEIVLKEG